MKDSIISVKSDNYENESTANCLKVTLKSYIDPNLILYRSKDLKTDCTIQMSLKHVKYVPNYVHRPVSTF